MSYLSLISFAFFLTFATYFLLIQHLIVHYAYYAYPKNFPDHLYLFHQLLVASIGILISFIVFIFFGISDVKIIHALAMPIFIVALITELSAVMHGFVLHYYEPQAKRIFDRIRMAMRGVQ